VVGGKERCVIVSHPEGRTALTETRIAELTGAERSTSLEVGDKNLEFVYFPGDGPSPPVLVVLGED